MHALVISFLILGFSTDTSAGVEICDENVQLPIVTLAKLGLQKGELATTDIRSMIESAEGVANPYLQKPPTIGNHAFRRRMERSIHGLQAEEIPKVKGQLEALLAESSYGERRALDARAQTTIVIAPRIASLPPPKYEFKYEVNEGMWWYTNQAGDLRLAVYHPAKSYLTVYDPSHSSVVVDRALNPEFRNTTVNHLAFIKPPGAEPYLFHCNGRDSIMVHSLEDNTTFSNPFPGTVSIATAFGPRGDIYLIAFFAKGIEIHTLNKKMGKMERIGEYIFSGTIRNLQTLNSTNGKILILVTEGDRTVHVIDPFGASRKYTSKYLVMDVAGTLTEKGGYFVTIRNVVDVHDRLEFLSSDSPIVPSIENLPASFKNGAPLLTADGVLVPIAKRDEMMAYELAIYKPFASTPRELKNLVRQWLGIQPVLSPSIRLRGGSGAVERAPDWINDANGKLYLVQTFNRSSDHPPGFEIFSLESPYPIERRLTPWPMNIHSLNRIQLRPQTPPLYLINSLAQMRVLIGDESFGEIFDTRMTWSAGIARDRHGNFYLAGADFDSSVQTSNLKLIKLTARDSEGN